MATIYPISSLLSSVYVPDFFESKRVSTSDGTLIKDVDFTIERDINGRDSIIRLNKIPFLDFSFYDTQRKRWFATDKYGGKWRQYGLGEWIPEWNIFNGTNPKAAKVQLVSMDGMEQGAVVSARSKPSYKFRQYKPIILSVNNFELNDIQNYSGGQTIVPKLDEVNPDRNKEFYYDFKNTIYTNQDFSLYEDEDILIEFTINISDINISCRMDTNIVNLSPYTPIVDYYIVKLTGQNL